MEVLQSVTLLYAATVNDFCIWIVSEEIICGDFNRGGRETESGKTWQPDGAVFANGIRMELE
jgi:hypothetical protein